ncbi:MAG: hypothetical protein Q7S19_00380 [bacterium]|nr:hypothetical protein [bacterium]
MKNPKVIIYDNDGMICHSGRFSDSYSKEFGIEMDIMSPFFEGPFKNCLVGKADLKEELEKVLDIWNWKGTANQLLDYWFSVGSTLDEKVFPTISKFKDQGLIVCLATNQEKYRKEYLVTKFGYDKVFNEIFSSAELGAYKNSEKGLQKTFDILKDKYGIEDRDEIMYWDDREGNVEHINQFGMNGQHYKNYEEFRDVMAGLGYLV